MATLIRKATEHDPDVLRALNVDVQALHAAALPSLFKPPGQDAAAEARGGKAERAIWDVGPLLAEPDHLFFIAEVDGTPAGYAWAEIQERPETPLTHAYAMVYLHHLSVRPAHRRRGIGTALIDAVRAAAAEAGIGRVALDVWFFNEDARTFFRRRGFAACHERMWNQPAPAPARNEDR